MRRSARRLGAERVRRVAVVFVAAALGAGAAAAPAAADQTLEATGSITYTWQGDPSLGCAAVGVCDVQGALIVEVQGSVDLQQLRHQSILNFNTGTAPTVRVLTGTGPSASECVDAPPNQGGVTVFVRSSAGGLVGTITPPLSSGRCAGPLVSDLQGVGLSVRRSAGKHPSFDLRTDTTFVAGPFVGTLVSTVTTRPAPSFGSNTSSSSGSFSSPGPAPRKLFIEHVRLRYQVSGLSEPLTVSFAGENDPFCVVLGSCGVSGDVGLSAPAFSGTLVLRASRLVARRRSAAQAIADLKQGRMRLFGGLSSGIETSESFDPPDGSPCQDSAPNTGVLTVGDLPPGRGTSVELAESDTNVDLLRTHCPGPSSADVFGGSGFLPVARSAASVAQFLAPKTTLTLGDPGDFTGAGYTGSRSGAIGFSLTRESISAGTSGAAR